MVSILPTGAGQPALLNRQSNRPKVFTAVAIMAFTSSSRETSVFRNLTFSPKESANIFPSFSRRAATRTDAPSCAKTSTVRRPIPLVPPVMIATFPANLPAMGLLLFVNVIQAFCLSYPFYSFRDRDQRSRKTNRPPRPGERTGEARSGGPLTGEMGMKLSAISFQHLAKDFLFLVLAHRKTVVFGWASFKEP
jgi:hypothetical protein